MKVIIQYNFRMLLILVLFFFINRTANCQYQWQIIPFNSPSTLTDSHFFDETFGIIVGDSGTYLETSNGGLNWIELPKFTKKNLTSVKFIDSKFGIITSYDTLFITNDGAKNWQKKGFGLNSYFYNIGFSDNNNIWIVGESGNILYTSDGGKNWNNFNIGIGWDLFNIYVINQNKVLLSGSNGYIARIIKKGELTEYLDLGSDSYVTSMFFLKATTGFVSIDSLKILKTTDAGNTWKEVHKGNPDDWIMSFEFIDNSEGWAVSDMGLILKTTDGGNTWQEVLNTGRPLNSCFFLNKHIGFITGFMGTIYKYSDYLNSVVNNRFTEKINHSIVIDKNKIKINTIEPGSGIELFNSFGVSLFKTIATSSESNISTDSFANGIYFLVVNNEIFKILKY